MTATNIQTVQQSAIFRRPGMFPCRIKLLNFGCKDNIEGYATVVEVHQAGRSPYVNPHTVHRHTSLIKAYKDYHERVWIYGAD